MSIRRQCDILELGPAALSQTLAAISLVSLARTKADAEPHPGNKRKAPTVPRAHWGLASDSSERLNFVALSRLTRSGDKPFLAQAAGSPIGVAVMDALRDLVLRVAVTVGGADHSLNATSVATLLNLSGSSFDRASRYDSSSLTLPGKLPFRNAKALIRSLLDALTASLITTDGSTVSRLLLRIPPATLDDDTRTAIARLMKAVEVDVITRLQSRGEASSSSSSSIQPQPALPQPALPQPQGAIDATASLISNMRRIVEARLHRPMTQVEIDTLEVGLLEALGVLDADNEETRRARLQANMLVALSVPAAAQLWAIVLDAVSEAAGDGSEVEVSRLIEAATEAASSVAGAKLATTLRM